MDRDSVEEQVERLRALARAAVEQLGPVSGLESFGYDRRSLEWVEGFLERQRPRWPKDPPIGLINSISAFLGECLISATGGVWDWDDVQESWAVRFPSGSAAFPFAKVWKQFENGLEGGDSILGFYDVGVDYVASGKLDRDKG